MTSQPGDAKPPSPLVAASANQYRWRRWSTVYPWLGDLAGADVLDLGCGIGDQARDLAQLGARVLGVDANREAIDHAASRAIAGARFACDGVTNLARHGTVFDGIWASFVAAYFPRFDALLDAIGGVVKPGGWLALTELDDLFGHRPLDARWVDLVERYYARSLDQGFHRFRSHDHVVETLTRRGWRIEIDRTVEDDEFASTGRVAADVLEGWRSRLGSMMPRFRERFGDAAAGFDAAFLECLESRDHRSESRVWFLLARAPPAP